MNHLQEGLTRIWDEERGRVGKVQAIKEKLDALKVEIEHAERGYDLNKAAELKYAVMPKLQVRLGKFDLQPLLCFLFLRFLLLVSRQKPDLSVYLALPLETTIVQERGILVKFAQVTAISSVGVLQMMDQNV